MCANQISQLWPVNRQYARVRLTGPFQINDGCGHTLAGLCRDISEEGMSGSLTTNLETGARVGVSINLPATDHMLELQAMNWHIRGQYYGFRFIDPDDAAVAEIRKFVARSAASAFLLSPEPTTVRKIQHQLQVLGMPQASLGGPKSLPVLHPHLVVIDSDWPDYLEVMEFLRSEATHARIVILTLIANDALMSKALAGGADLVIRKPLDPIQAARVLRLACRLVMGEPEVQVAAPIPPAKELSLPALARVSGEMMQLPMPLPMPANREDMLCDFSGAPWVQPRTQD